MSIILDWTEEHTQKFQDDIAVFNHAVAETGLFTDEALIRLMEKHPSEQMDVCTMASADHPKYPNRFLTGDFRDADGKTLIEAAKAGKVWINLRRAMNIHPEYKEVLDAMYGGIAEKIGQKVFNANGGILISSPIAKVPYHFDKTETILWHVRGKKRIWIYPLTQDFIPDKAYEATITDALMDDLPYEAGFDDHARFFDLEPGQAIKWPLNSPHRVDNDSYCISITTEYSTSESGFKNAVMVANATLRHRFGATGSYSTDGQAARVVKSVLGRALKKSGLARVTTPDDYVRFKVDPSAPNYIVDVEEPFVRNF